MIQFKIGMAYATLAKNTSAIICNRSKSFVTVKTVCPGSPDKIFRKKISVFTSSITDDYEYIKNDGLRDAWCNAVEFADEQPATAETTPASDNDNATASQPANVANAESETSTQPEPLYDDDSFSDAPGDNSYPEQDIPECRENDAIHADNPGFTVIPSREIKRPDYASYPEAIHDDIPCVNVPACDIQTYNHAAVVHERNTSTAEGFGIVLLKHRQLGFTFNTDCNPRQIWFDFEF